MDPVLIGVLSLALLTFLIIVNMPIAFAMWIVGAAGLIYVTNVGNMLTQMQIIAFNWSFNFMIAVVPLFIWMGYIIAESGIAEDLYSSLAAWLGWLPGGLAIATSLASAGFGSMSSSSYAALVLFNRTALPEMMKYGYDKRLAAGIITSAGTFAHMIPPSILLVLIGILAEQPIGQVLLAGYIPGFMTATVYGIIAFIVGKFLKWGPPIPQRFTLKQRIVSLRAVWGVLLMITILLGGIYGGIFTPTEAAAYGCLGAVIIAAARRKLTWQRFQSGAMAAGRAIGMIFALLIGALLFSRFLVLSGFIDEIAEVIAGWGLSGVVLIGIIMVMYIILGMFMTSLSMIIVTLPFVLPAVTDAGYSGVWLVIMLVKMTEIASVTPPVGMNLFVSKATVPPEYNISLLDIIIGSNVFTVADLIMVVLMIAYPQIVLFLPSTMAAR